jgi:mono/diheme cytochrome c family protein
MIKKLIVLMSLSILFACNNSEEQKSNEEMVPQKIVHEPELQKSIERGEIIYYNKCADCHTNKRLEFPDRYPPLIGSNWLTERRKETIHAAKYGRRGKIIVNGKEYNSIMIPVQITDQQVADVLNYVKSFGGITPEDMYTIDEVKSVPKKMKR